MTPDITDQDEREAIYEARCIIKWQEGQGRDADHPVVVSLGTLRALLHRATRAHD